MGTTWKCEVCGYVHEGAAPPDICPVCGVGPDMFSPFETMAPQAGGAPGPAGHAGQGRVVVVGGGIAAVNAADAARQSDPEVGVSLVSDEPGLPYYRLNLSRLLAGEIQPDDMALHPQSWYDERRIELLQDRVATIDIAERSLALERGGSLGFGQLILATGARPFVPPMQGVDLKGVYCVRRLEDVSAILGACRAGDRCLCLGGGLLGLEAAGALARRGLSVTVLEMAEWLLPRQVAQPGGRLLQATVEAKGIRVRCGVRAQAIEGEGHVRGVRLDGGELLEADLVVISAGVRPATELARQAGLEVDRGIVVDAGMRTSAAVIWAAGDVAQFAGRVDGLWTTAFAQGKVAGTNAAGGAVTYPGLPPSTRLKVLDVHLYSAGRVDAQDGTERVIEHAEASRYLRLVLREGLIVGANLVGDVSLARAIGEAIEGRRAAAAIDPLRRAIPELLEG